MPWKATGHRAAAVVELLPAFNETGTPETNTKIDAARINEYINYNGIENNHI